MTIRIHRLLEHWYPQRDELDWVLGTIISTKRSAYRKAGAMMLINSLGQRFGMLSGGCLEGDLLAQARKVMFSGHTKVVEYDLRDDSDSPWQRGIGCGGAVDILLQPITKTNAYLGLDQIHASLQKNDTSLYFQRVDKIGNDADFWEVSLINDQHISLFPSITQQQSHSFTKNNEHWMVTRVQPAPRLLIFGGGMDAEPLARLALDIGWQVTVVDGRVGYAAEDNFPGAQCLHDAPENIENIHADAIVIMNHNVTLDAQSLVHAQKSNARFVGILGPEHRRQKVESAAGLSPKDFSAFYCGPVGLEIGATLPETIALSILAQCHQIIEGKERPTQSLSAEGSLL